MAGLFNMKSVFTADTKDLKKGAAEAKQAVKEFDNTTTEALDQVTSLLGTSMAEINSALASVSGGLLKLSTSFKTASTGATGLSKALRILTVALKATGIGAIVVALGSLVAYFTKSQRGADKLAVVMGQLKQAFFVVTDWAIKLGEKIVGFFEGIANRVAIIKEQFKIGGGNASFIGPEESSSLSVFQKRKQLTKEQQEYERKRIDFIVREAELELELNKQREIAADKANKTLEEREAANLKAQEILKQLFGERVALKQEELALLVRDNSLSESMLENIEEQRVLQAAILNLKGALASQNKELLGQEAEIANQKKAQAEAAQKAAAAALEERKKKDLTLEKKDSSSLLDRAFKTKEFEIPQQEFKKTEAFMLDMQQIATDFSNTMTDAFASMIEGLVSGELNMRDIFSTILSFLAENLKAIGKALIAYGTAMEAFKTAFKDPWVAIAAGAALVAAGSVLSGLIGRMVSGGGSTPSASYAAAATVGGGGTLDLTTATTRTAQAQKVEVTGTLYASGNVLKAVLKNEDKREFYTT